MTARWLPRGIACSLLLAIRVSTAAADYPGHEVWLGVGGGASMERSIFNVPSDLESSPEAVVSFGYTMNLDARRAVSAQVYGTAETTPRVTLVSPTGTQETEFDLYTYNLGARFRYTFSRGVIAPYVFAGPNVAFGSVESPPTGRLSYSGVSACLGPGASVGLGRSFLLSAELLASFGAASWEQKPFNNSTGKEFNPSLVGGTINLSFVWGRRR